MGRLIAIGVLTLISIYIVFIIVMFLAPYILGLIAAIFAIGLGKQVWDVLNRPDQHKVDQDDRVSNNDNQNSDYSDA